MQLSKRQAVVIVAVIAVALIAIAASVFLLLGDKTSLEGTDPNMSEKPTPWEGSPKPSPTVVQPSPDPEKNSDGTTPIYLKSNDYTYLWFRDRCLTQVGKDHIVNVRTGNYGLSVNLNKASIVKLGTMPHISYDDALTEDNSAIDALPGAGVGLEITENGNVYNMTEIYNDEYGNNDILFNARMIRSGTYMQSFDINSIRFGGFDGDARLEFNATPDYFTMSYDFYTTVTHDNVDLKMTFTVPSSFKQVDKIELDGGVRAIRIADDAGNSYTVLATDGDNGIASISYDDNGTITLENKGISLRLSTSQRTRRDGIGLLVIPGSTDVNDAKQFIYPLTANDISAVGIEPYDRTCKIVYNPRRAVYEIELRAAQVSIPNQYTYVLERVAMEIVNNADYKIKPMLAYKHTPNVNGIGTLPILREKDGTPTGIVIQPCKNWHTTEGMPLYNDGSWYEAYVPINVLPNSKSEFEYTSAFDAWGDVPAVSHTQLCLIGYGGPQWQWEQSAIGAFGENFCYSPDLYIVSFMADMRPLMVTGSAGGKFEWTDSVAGADFLVYFDENNKQQFLKQVKTQYYDHGPNLTHIKYAGVTMV